MALVDSRALSLDLLKTLVVFSESGTVEETARRLGMTQAGVSLQLKKLEEQIGEPLFRAQGRKKALTDFARDLCQTVAPPLNELAHRLDEASRRVPDPSRRTLRVGGRAEILSQAIDRIDFPGGMTLQAMTDPEALSALREDRVDLAILADAPGSPEFISKHLFDEEIVLAIPAAWKKTRTWEDVENDGDFPAKPAAAYTMDAPFLNEVAAALGVKPNLKFVCEDWGGVGKFVTGGRAWAAMPLGTVPAGCQIVTIPPRVLKSARFHAVYGRHGRGIAEFLKV